VDVFLKHGVVMNDARSLKWGCWLKQRNFINFRYILTKLDIQVYILLFNSCVKFYAIFQHFWNIKSHMGYFLCSLDVHVPHLKCVTVLLCEIQKIENSKFV